MSNLNKVSKKDLELLSHKDCVRFALFCAEQVKEGWKDIPECVVTVEAVKRWLEGKAAGDECLNAAYAAAYAAANAANAAAYAVCAAAKAAANAAAATYAACAANAAAYAVCAAAYENPHLIEAQWEYYLELLHFDDIAEKLLLGGVV